MVMFLPDFPPVLCKDNPKNRPKNRQVCLKGGGGVPQVNQGFFKMMQQNKSIKAATSQ